GDGELGRGPGPRLGEQAVQGGGHLLAARHILGRPRALATQARHAGADKRLQDRAHGGRAVPKVLGDRRRAPAGRREDNHLDAVAFRWGKGRVAARRLHRSTLGRGEMYSDHASLYKPTGATCLVQAWLAAGRPPYIGRLLGSY